MGLIGKEALNICCRGTNPLISPFYSGFNEVPFSFLPEWRVLLLINFKLLSVFEYHQELVHKIVRSSRVD